MEVLNSCVLNEKEFGKLFEVCFKQHFKSLCFYAMSFVRDEDVAKDIVHDVFLSVWNRRGEIDFTQPIYPYFLSMVRNSALNHLAHLRVKLRHEEFQLKLGDQYIEVDFDEHEELVQSIITRINQLPDRCGEVMILCFVECKKYKEIAEILDISVNTVKTHITTGLKVLRSEYPTSVLLMILSKIKKH